MCGICLHSRELQGNDEEGTEARECASEHVNVFGEREGGHYTFFNWNMSSSLEGSALKDVFTKYANFGVGLNKTNVLDNSKFFKLIKECGLIDDKLTRPEVDIAFQKVKLSVHNLGHAMIFIHSFCKHKDHRS